MKHRILSGRSASTEQSVCSGFWAGRAGKSATQTVLPTEQVSQEVKGARKDWVEAAFRIS